MTAGVLYLCDNEAARSLSRVAMMPRCVMSKVQLQLDV